MQTWRVSARPQWAAGGELYTLPGDTSGQPPVPHGASVVISAKWEQERRLETEWGSSGLFCCSCLSAILLSSVTLSPAIPLTVSDACFVSDSCCVDLESEAEGIKHRRWLRGQGGEGRAERQRAGAAAVLGGEEERRVSESLAGKLERGGRR